MRSFGRMLGMHSTCSNAQEGLIDLLLLQERGVGRCMWVLQLLTGPAGVGRLQLAKGSHQTV